MLVNVTPSGVTKLVDFGVVMELGLLQGVDDYLPFTPFLLPNMRVNCIFTGEAEPIL